MAKPSNRVFVFGSNLRGRHGAGSALHAAKEWGAVEGVAVGRTGNAYGIATKDALLTSLPLATIKDLVAEFIVYAIMHQDLEFNVVAIGCGLAGYKPEEIAPMFKMAPTNCILPPAFRRVLSRL